ncbi:MAG: VOC family protein [Saprospiraceae bacterium]|nr:VOC family protein [Saprospiraceae bacterium]
MNPVVHFELPYLNAGRARKFYESAFGWKTDHLGEFGGNYILVTTAESDVRPGFPAGAINGGLFPVKPEWPAQYPSIVIGVNDIDEAILRISQSGGEVLGEPMEIPNFGIYVSFLDTEGNRSSIIQAIGA